MRAERRALLPTLQRCGIESDEDGQGMSSRSNLRIGIDTGGTFTDIVCVDDGSGAMRVTKVASTPQNPAIALVRGVHAILGQAGAGVDDLAVLAHGTTVATNALLQGEIAGLGLIVTEGFRHLCYKNDHEINAAEWIVYDALYAYCKRMAEQGKPDGAFK